MLTQSSDKYLVILQCQTILVILSAVILVQYQVTEKKHKHLLRLGQPTPLGAECVLPGNYMSTHTKPLAFNESFLCG